MLKRSFRFRLVDLLAVGFALAFIVPLCVLGIHFARHWSRQRQCQETLRHAGVAFWMHAENDPGGYLCSGATDIATDGSIDTYGWVADLQSHLDGLPLIDPANPAVGLSTLNDVLAGDATTWSNNGLPERYSDQPLINLMSRTKPMSNERAQWVAEHVISEGINTNYCASWLLTRQGIKLVTQPPNFSQSVADPAYQNFQGLPSTTGPLKMSVIDRSRISSRTMPLLGCGAPEVGNQGRLMMDIGPLTASSQQRERLGNHLPAGTALSRTVNRGPAFWHSVQGTMLFIKGGDILDTQMDGERGYGTTENCPPPIGPKANHTYLQDTRGWKAVHGTQINILMADGSIRVFDDLNGDGFLNPGFPVPNSTNSTLGTDYSDDTVKLHPSGMFNGLFVEEIFFNASFGG